MYFLLRPILGKSFLLLQKLVRKTNVRLLLKKHSSDFRKNRICHESPRPKIGRTHFRTGELVRKSGDRLVYILQWSRWNKILNKVESFFQSFRPFFKCYPFFSYILVRKINSFVFRMANSRIEIILILWAIDYFFIFQIIKNYLLLIFWKHKYCIFWNIIW